MSDRVASPNHVYLIVAITVLYLYAYFAADRDGYAFQQALTLVFPSFKGYGRLAYLAAFFLSAAIAILNGRFLRDQYLVLAIILTLMLWVMLSSFSHGLDVVATLSVLVYTGLPALVVLVVADVESITLIRVLFLYLLAQMLLAATVLLFESMYILDGSVYKALEGVSVINNDSLNVGDDLRFDKSVVARYAQFHNPNALGFYASAGFVFGLAAIFGILGPGIWRLSGVGLASLSFFCWLNALTRGPLAVCVLVILLIGIIRISNRDRLNPRIAGLVLLVSIVVVPIFLNLLTSSSFLIPASDDASVSYRIYGYIGGYEATLNNPLFGVGLSWNWADYSYPHLLPLSYSADFGLLAGCLITLLVFGVGARCFYRALLALSSWDEFLSVRLLSVLCLSLVWGAAVTNNVISPVLFWSLYCVGLTCSSLRSNGGTSPL
jgi:O-Antigen ligase